MSAYVRELLYESIYDPHDTPTLDINMGLKQLLAEGRITMLHIRLVWMYVSGYSVEEMVQRVPNAEDLLRYTFSCLEQTTRYSDDFIINMGLSKYPKYKKIAPALRRHMVKLSQDLERNDL